MATRLEGIATEVHVELADATVKACHDRKDLKKNDQKRRIVWITEGGTTEDPRQGGGRQPEYEAEAHVDSQFRIVPCKTRLERVDAWIFAERRELAERLLDNLIAAVCLTVPSVDMPSYRWLTEEEAALQATAGTACVILTMIFRLVVPDQVRPLLPVTGIDTDCGIDRDDGSFEHEDGTVDPPPP